MKFNSTTKTLLACFGLCTLVSFSATAYADWVVQVAASPNKSLLNDQANRMKAEWPDVRIVEVDQAPKLVVGQFATTKEANATLRVLQLKVPGAFLRKADDFDRDNSSAMVSTISTTSKTPETAHSVSVDAPVYDPSTWIKR
jgi:hypothetical protein